MTLASGFSFMKSSASAESFSPSVPMAQTVMSPDALPCATLSPCSASSPPESRPQADAASATAVMAASKTVRLLGRVMPYLRSWFSWGPQLVRITSRVGSTSRRTPGEVPEIRSSSQRAAVAPSSRMDWCTVVSRA